MGDTIRERIVKSKSDYMKDVLVALFTGYICTFLGIVLLAFLLLFFQLSEDMVDIGIVVIYILACLSLGIVAGKRTKNKKFLWGMAGGGIYFLILILISLAAHHSLGGEGKDMITTFFICVGSGALGGMLS